MRENQAHLRVRKAKPHVSEGAASIGGGKCMEEHLSMAQIEGWEDGRGGDDVLSSNAVSGTGTEGLNGI